jgi:hypothetical protein
MGTTRTDDFLKSVHFELGNTYWAGGATGCHPKKAKVADLQAKLAPVFRASDLSFFWLCLGFSRVSHVESVARQ